MKHALAGLLLLFSYGSANAVVIDFDSLPTGTIVTNQFAEVTFSAASGNVIAFSGAGLNGATLPNAITVDSQIGFGTVIANFTSAVNNLMFDVVGINNFGDIGDIVVQHSGGSTVYDIIGAGFNVPVTADLSAYTNITQITIGGITDVAGVAYDNFSFDVSAVPEPATLVLMGLGLAGLGFRRSKVN